MNFWKFRKFHKFGLNFGNSKNKIVLLPGLFGSANELIPIINDCEVIVFNFENCRKQQLAFERIMFSLDNFSAAVERIVRSEFRDFQVIFIGYSFGGRIGIEICKKNRNYRLISISAFRSDFERFNRRIFPRNEFRSWAFAPLPPSPIDKYSFPWLSNTNVPL